jgi:hypothetical protein
VGTAQGQGRRMNSCIDLARNFRHVAPRAYGNYHNCHHYHSYRRIRLRERIERELGEEATGKE